MCSLVGGANATPFTTHSEAMDTPLFLRIAPELHLKQLVIGGLERVYEIGNLFYSLSTLSNCIGHTGVRQVLP